MSGELIELRPIAEWDIPEVLIAHQDDPGLHRWLGLSKPPTGAELGSQVENAEAQRLAGAAIRLTIVEPGSNDCLGRVEVDGFDWERRSAIARVWAVAQPRERALECEHGASLLAGEWLESVVGLREVNWILRSLPTP